MKTYSQAIRDISKYPNPQWSSTLWFVLHLLKYGPKLLKSIKRIVRANLVVNDFQTNPGNNVLIDVLIPCTAKDLRTLPLSIQSVIASSLNPINKIWIVCPPNQVTKIEECLISFKFSNQVQVISESMYIDKQLYDYVFDSLGAKAGHAIQQLLKVSFVAQSNLQGILVLDSDTVLLQECLWLDQFENQVLQLGWENIPEHYLHLEKLCKTNFDKSYNTVTHHMLMQPNWMRNFIKKCTNLGLNDFLYKAFDYSQKDIQSVFSLDYLFYGLNSIKYKQSKVHFTRWCNTAVDPSELNIESENLESLKKKYPYKSISFHHWQE
jgi:hypothetical protein